MSYYKATRPDATSFYDGKTKWRVGRVVRHPAPDLSLGLCSVGVLHFSDASGEVLMGGSWPCRLFEVEPRGPVIGPKDHKYGTTALEVVAEFPAWQALGPNGEEVAALIDRARMLTKEEIKRLYAAAYAAGPAARYVARLAAAYAAGPAARYAAENAARYAAWDAARYAAWLAAWDAAGYAARYAAAYAAENAARVAVLYVARDAAGYAARYAAARYAAENAARSAARALVVKDLISSEQFELLYGSWGKVIG
jgi:hypothetical protein